jgi:hypothetical protein
MRLGWVWWSSPAIPALWMLRQKNCELEANLDYFINRPYPQKRKIMNTEKINSQLELFLTPIFYHP